MKLGVKSWALGMAVWLAAAAAATAVRLYPSWGHIWSPSHETATMLVVYKIKQSFAEQIRQQNPQAPVALVEQMATAKLNETLRKDNTSVLKTIEKVNAQMAKQNRGPSPTYLLESDPFHFFNLTENIVKHGRIAPVIVGNKYLNALMCAPFGHWEPLTFHPYVGHLMYQLARMIDSQVPLMTAVAWTPVLVTVLALGAFVWCARGLALSFPAILAGVFYFAMVPVFLKRSALGWYDTDPYNLLFPLLVLGILFRCVPKPPPPWQTGMALAAVLLGHCLMWQGWMYLFVMTMAFVLTMAAHAWIGSSRSVARTHIVGLFCMVLTLMVLGSLVYGGPAHFLNFFHEGTGELKKFTIKGLNLWPNLFLEVGELKKSSLADILRDTGGWTLWLGALLGLGRLWPVRQWRDAQGLRVLLVLMFLAVTLAMTAKAERFSILMVSALGLLFTVGIEQMFGYARRFRSERWIVTAATAGLLTHAWWAGNRDIRTVLTPIFNNTWEQVLSTIDRETPSKAIVNTWWPPGHFIKAIAHRRVPFDGASLSESQIGYWMASMFLSDNERLAAGILRMINLSGGKAADLLVENGLKTSQAVHLLKELAPLNRSLALAKLQKVLNAEDAKELLDLTHGQPDPHYVLVYNELVDQNLGLAFVARRDLAAIEDINSGQGRAPLPPPASPAYIDFLWKLSGGGPPRYSEVLPFTGMREGILSFGDGLQITADMNSARVVSNQYGQGIPLSLIYRKGDGVVEAPMENATLGYSVVLYEQDGQPICRLMDRDLARSMLVRLYFFNGAGLQQFKPLTSAADLTGRTRIKVFQVTPDS